MRYMNIFVGALSVLALMSCSDDSSDKAQPDIDMQLILEIYKDEPRKVAV